MYGDAVLLEEVVDRDDVRVAQRARDPRLADEALRERRVAGQERRELLQRDVAPEAGLAREVHDGHPAPPDLLDDPVRTDLLRRHGHALTGARRAMCGTVSPSAGMVADATTAMGIRDGRR